MRISDIAHFTHSKNLNNIWKSFNSHLISCENYLSSWKCATTPELSEVCNINGKVKNSKIVEVRRGFSDGHAS